MEKPLMNYLEKIDNYLRPMPTTDRADIIKEIQSNMLDLQSNDGLSPEQIIERLGEPKAMARAYLGEAIYESKSYGYKKFFLLLSFYSMVGLSGMIILPFTSITSIAFLFSGILAPIFGASKLIASFFGWDLPFIMFQIGSYTLSPLPAFLFSFIIGAILIALGVALWKITIGYIKWVSRKSQEIEINGSKK